MLFHANNHSGDFGPEAFSEILEYNTSHRLHFRWWQQIWPQHTPWIIEKNIYSTVLLGHNEFCRVALRRLRVWRVPHGADEQLSLISKSETPQSRPRHPLMHWGWKRTARGTSASVVLPRK